MTQPETSLNGGVGFLARSSTRGSAAGNLAAGVLDALLPPQCLGCGTLVGGGGVLCPSCWETVTFLSPPQCDACGLPFEYDPGVGALCGACVREKPVYERARAAMIYNEASRRLVLAFKHGDRTDAAPAFGAWLARAGRDLLADAGLIAPVPLHWSRLFTRRYNQSALLAKALGRVSGVSVTQDLLIRRRRTPPQGRMSPSARKRNVRGAFAIRKSKASLIEGKRVLLIDDVLTTGATVSASARALIAAGAEAVDVLTLARVIRPSP